LAIEVMQECSGARACEILGISGDEAVHTVSQAEHRRLLAREDPILAETRRLWRYGMEHMPAATAARFDRTNRVEWKAELDRFFVRR
jgi:hypothetical protein